MSVVFPQTKDLSLSLDFYARLLRDRGFGLFIPLQETAGHTGGVVEDLDFGGGHGGWLEEVDLGDRCVWRGYG